MTINKPTFVALCFALLVCLLTVRGLAVRNTELKAKTVAAELAAATAVQKFELEKDRSDSLAALLPRLEAAAQAAAAPLQHATARTLTAAAALDSVRAAALAEASRNADTLRSAIRDMANSEQAFEARVRQERDSVNARLTAEMDWRAALEHTASQQSIAIKSAEAALKDKDAVIALLKKGEAGVVHRGVRGLEIGGATAACAGIGWLLGGPAAPLTALGAGAVCAIAAGILAP